MSAIGRIGASYHQNAKSLPEYYDALHQGRLPVVRGIALSTDDLIRRDVIMALMCQGRVDFDRVDRAFGVEMQNYFPAEMDELTPLVAAGLVEIASNAVQVTAPGWYMVRAIAMVFDRYLHNDQQRQRFSRIL